MRHLKLRIKPLAAFLFLLILMPSLAGADELSPVIENLQKRYERIRTIEAGFTQEFRSAMGGAQTSKGRVYLKKPGKMRWAYEDPVKDEIVSDGKTVWLYQPDLNQVILRKADAATASIAADFLTGIGDLKKDFDMELSNETPGAWTLRLRPKAPQPNIRSLLMDIDRKSTLVTSTVVVDHFGNETRVSFHDIKVNNALADSFFEFTPPEGASVIRP